MNTLKTQAKTNNTIKAYLTINNIKGFEVKEKGVQIDMVLLTSVQDAKSFVKHLANFK